MTEVPVGCNDKPGFSGAAAHRRRGEQVCRQCLDAVNYYQQQRRLGLRPAFMRPNSQTSPVETPEYNINRHGRWFKNQEDAEEYAWRDKTRKAAKRAGWVINSRDDLVKFDEFRRQKQADRIEDRRQRLLQVEANNLRDLKKAAAAQKSTVTNMNPVVYKRKSSVPTAEDKLAMIKQMIEDKTPIMDFMIRTSNLVGANLKGNK